ncbi:hypothetical protein SAMN05421734_102443 [Pelagirhabdus alkalitolerans]|uniref:CAAX prenyl protease 2/Lysostaphin resistance protein A-like domain-containing protein n=1 Tax=Pelagirhabdus alkalitolerans TaxID=1612202 RepID=A0A1G6HB52_9BACI|nr:CPBP family intramembrane glutamic endopeptidase [Pelagirhabdus alkalitolerans]SDB91519.1 hypothetical protein SAMN05421734_102443 [Pelagirhabdus alkalitolerans]
MNHIESLKGLTPKEIRKAVYLTQLMLIAISLPWTLLSRDFSLVNVIEVDIINMFIYGVIPALLIVSIDFISYRYFPKHWWDDGGVNQLIFSQINRLEIIGLSGIIAISEEWLFRGVMQHHLGFELTAIIFALIHVRYLKKPFLVINLLIVSISLGVIMDITNNLLVVITLHFIVDLTLGLYWRHQSGGTYYVSTTR